MKLFSDDEGLITSLRWIVNCNSSENDRFAETTRDDVTAPLDACRARIREDAYPPVAAWRVEWRDQT